jgi:hypothetical protein
MTYGRERFEGRTLIAQGAAVSHLAELVRGEFLSVGKAPSSGPSGHLLPKGRRALRRASEPHCDRRACTKPDLARFT